MKVIINGCNGAMGQVLSRIIDNEDDIEILAGIDRNPERYNNNYPVYSEIFSCREKAEVIIDFSSPNSLKSLLEYGVEKRIPLVIATTGLSEENIESIVEASKIIPIFQSSNTSLGVNTLINLVKKAAMVLEESFDIEIIEKHHNKKVDAPSGTAYMIANAINGKLGNSKEFIYGREGNKDARRKNHIGIHAVRGGTIPGEHTVIFAGEDEVIEIKHTAFSKDIFAAGAVKAARYIIKQEKGLYNMDNLIS